MKSGMLGGNDNGVTEGMGTLVCECFVKVFDCSYVRL